ncbi:hypothetical protein MTBPR1_80148 [Candidatus Terasakiella magnetica]|uniref:Uncharacterized protein n=1 Tax=Candidatus Terasakiella magnetica TaxID=1867952 RepID=A0A1C3RLD8_9PROT|nr:hypothetical protein [Candidatus Terasakiella magnetica]SCA58094.1 hypothetical protein MTBPR1_80148 [Candidatus Terasakiella magnetica]
MMNKQNFIPHGAIAGSLRADPSGVDLEIIYENVEGDLGTENVHLVYQRQGNVIHYMAAASREFKNHKKPINPLATFLPGGNDHQGPGIYHEPNSNTLLVVPETTQEISLAYGLPSEWYGEEDLQVFDISEFETTETVQWQSYILARLNRQNQIFKFLFYPGAAFLLVLIGLLYLQVTQKEILQTEVSEISREIERSMHQALREMKRHREDKHLEVLADYSTIVKDVLSMDGELLFYKYENGKSAWQAKIPKWASETYADKLEKLKRKDSFSPRNDHKEGTVLIGVGSLVEKVK